jgi:23S rRNA (pseudouridine1915-N3)-methyltransferase
MPCELSEVREEKGNIPDLVRVREGERIIKSLNKSSRLILLDETGDQFSSPGFASFIGKERDHGTQELALAVGGAFGFAQTVRESAYKVVSLSKMTFTHQMIRPFLLEQVYRALTILNNESYHH